MAVSAVIILSNAKDLYGEPYNFGFRWFDIAHHRFWIERLFSPRPLGKGEGEES
jgi:hypothetical protein